jgi:hypothetical protein
MRAIAATVRRIRRTMSHNEPTRFGTSLLPRQDEYPVGAAIVDPAVDRLAAP